MSEARTGVDVQAGESKVVGQADLQHGQVTLQPLLLVDHQVSPATTDRFHGSGGEIEANGEDIIRTQTSALQIGLQCRGQRTVIGDDQFDVRVGGHHAYEDGYASSGVSVGGVVDFLVNDF